ncbi:hypothetical protein [Candidatus Uabimicrobium amorphum]|uniref:Uncharacterized protein n=1 Tax=Uabimicrobium amorphum TaxID=2596890 RepID=A0A5S9IVE4_UABAM|nr:hypothetical protein [Candidatus Uabimicrobium amorphum]BBM88221.1 hypothetical protein UABAM_06642 [Candidatus Uabimicrobium amorphum]
MWKRVRGFTYKVVVVGCFCFLLLLNTRLYTTSLHGNSSREIVQQLHFIKGELQQGMAEDMQLFFPEGYFFSYVLYGLTWTNIAIDKQGTISNRAQQEALWALSHLDTPKGREPFPKEQNPSWGIFYKAWLNWLRGGILKLGNNAQLRKKFTADCDEITDAFRNSVTPFLTSYTNAAWPVDSVIGIAVLCLHDHLFPHKYQDVINAWLQKAKSKLDNGLLAHYVDHLSGDTITGARATSQSVLLRFLPEISATWSKEQYTLFRQRYVKTIFGLPAVKEFPPGKSGVGDVDSGPLIFGFSTSSSTVTIATAKVHGDPLYSQLMDTAEMVTIPMCFGNEKYHFFGLLPIGDAFLAWSKSIVLWTRQAESEGKYERVTSRYWRVPFHVFSLMLMIPLLFPVWRKAYKNYKNK